MFYWIIPYLVGYHAENWNYGPEHVFKAELTNVASNSIHDSTDHIFIKFSCRPVQLSLIYCYVNSATKDTYQWNNGTIKKRSISNAEYGLRNVAFKIIYDEGGISTVNFLNNSKSYVHEVIVSIIETMTVGISTAGKIYGEYVSYEKSTMGTCNTSFVISDKTLSKKEKKHKIRIKGFNFYVPFSASRNYNRPIIVEKIRHPSECKKKMTNFFTSYPNVYAETGSKMEELIEISNSKFNLGKNSFSSSTVTSGTIVVTSENKFIEENEISIDTLVRVTLESIRPATYSILTP